MQSYLDIVSRVLQQGTPKQPVRFDGAVGGGQAVPTSQDTIGLPCVYWEHHLSAGFPLLTTKRVAWKSLRVELEGFIQGITSKAWYQERGCTIWDEWCNPTAVPAEIRNDREAVHNFMRQHDDLGPVYGRQWRAFAGSDYDQLRTIADRLRENPYDRRFVCSAWAPNQMSQMALPPCHLIWNAVVYGDELNLWFGMRSCDLMLGIPFNIASYALLTHLLAAHANLKPGKLSLLMGDCHIYTPQIRAAQEQVQRQPRKLPTLTVLGNKPFDILRWTHADVSLVGYDPHPPLAFGEVLVT